MLKTNVMRILDKAKIPYEGFEYSSQLTEGVLIAETLGEDKNRVFKTLVTESGTGEHYVFVIPVAETLDLKAAARAVNAKSVSMLKQKELLPLTGYIHGGCSPVGMKKLFHTVIDKSAESQSTICFSGGKIGYQMEAPLSELEKVVPFELADITM